MAPRVSSPVMADDPGDVIHDIRAVRDRIARELASDLSEGEIMRVAETAQTILGMSIAERATLSALLRDVQAGGLPEPEPPKRVWPDEDVAAA